MSVVRLTIRLDTDIEDELQTLNWIRSSRGTSTDLICKAVNYYIESQKENEHIKRLVAQILEEERKSLRQTVGIPIPIDATKTADGQSAQPDRMQGPTDEEKKLNDANAKAFLSALLE